MTPKKTVEKRTGWMDVRMVLPNNVGTQKGEGSGRKRRE
jgi:hypothetical protein